MTDNLYTEILLDEYKNLQNKGEMPNADLVLEGSNSNCGDNITIYIKVQSPNDKSQIKEITWEGEGCVISQVAVSLLSKKLKEKKIKIRDIEKFSGQDMLELLGLEQISPGREKCLMLGLETIKKANLSTLLETSL
ncbi:MAG: iron-sulfur cluster assembly scaffold protein [Patescibacteria group bacterium]